MPGRQNAGRLHGASQNGQQPAASVLRCTVEAKQAAAGQKTVAAQRRSARSRQEAAEKASSAASPVIERMRRHEMLIDPRIASQQAYSSRLPASAGSSSSVCARRHMQRSTRTSLVGRGRAAAAGSNARKEGVAPAAVRASGSSRCRARRKPPTQNRRDVGSVR